MSSLAGAFGLAWATVVNAQSSPPLDTLAEARRLRDAGNYAAAAALARPYSEGHPDDPGSARFAALMSYWAKHVRAADSLYSAALVRHPGDHELRLEYGQLLVETGNGSRARSVLAPFAVATDSATSIPPAILARGRALVGTLAYWSGDFVEARRQFSDVLRLDPSHADARRQLREIELTTATWLRVGAGGWDDDQPLQRFAASVEGGWFANPLTPITLRTQATQFATDGVGESVALVDGSIGTYLPKAHIEFSLGAGLVQRTFGDATDWTGRAALGLRLHATTLLQVSAQRVPYVNTTASLSTPIMTESVDGLLRWRRQGWTAEAVARKEVYPDDNDITTGYVWILAPLVRRSRSALQAGYSFTAQSAANNHFVPRDESLVFPPGQPPSTVPGEYDPYYTPRNLRVHAALASARLAPNERWTLTADATIPLSARDDAPVLSVVSSPPYVEIVRTYYDRHFTPWNLRGGIDLAVTEAVHLALSVERGERAYYEFTSLNLSGTYTFVGAARRRADRR